MAIVRTQFTIQEKFLECPGVYTMRLKSKDKMDFKAGQFLMLHFPDNPKLTRSYSIASSPTRDLIDITFKVVGEFTKKLEAAPVGTVLNGMGAMGHFVFDEANDKHLVLIAGGVGFTPMRGMLQYVLDKKLPTQVTVLLSCQTSDVIPYKTELLELQKSGPKNVKVYLTMTREDASWNGPKGRLNADTLRKVIENPEDAKYFICGLNAMVDTLAALLVEMNVDKSKIKMEKWG